MESGAVLAAASLCSHRAMDIQCCISYTPIRMVADAIIEYPSCLAFTRSFIHSSIHSSPLSRKKPNGQKSRQEAGENCCC